VPTEIEQLYREHRAGLVRLIERELRDHHDAEDVVQTAFLDAQRALERGTIPRNPRAWLAAIALNAGRRLRRRRLNAEPLEEYAAQEAAAMPEIRAALASLPREQRTAVMYRDLLGLSYGETAEQMGTSVNAVTMLLHRGRRRLRQTLGLTAGGIGLWRWLKRAGMPQMAVAKGTAAVVITAGLATTGVVAARVIAPAAAAAPAPTSSGPPAVVPVRTPRGAAAHESAHRPLETIRGSSVSTIRSSTPASGGDAAAGPTSVPASRAETVATLTRSTPPAPAVSVPTLPISTPAVTVAVSTPVATATVSTPASTTVAVTTPIATVTVPIP
jgi:RNA polymerase sigma-70 factor (ECF subfamily)